MVDGKDTIYVDVDDEITGIIDKVKSSKQKIVALVLPKRASVFHSIVNMKLLHRAGDDANKHVVLITSEAGVLPLAGAVGLRVAKTLQSKPVVPPAPASGDLPLSVSEEEASDVDLDKLASVGTLAGIPDDEDETIQVDNADDATSVDTGKPKKNKKLKIPNFETFRTRLFLGILAFILLIVGWVFAAMVLPKAKITIKTDTATVVSNLNFTASPKAKALDKAKAIIPGETKDFKKTDSTSVATTGQKNNGTKATGKVTLSLTDCSKSQVTVPAGTLVTANSLSFVTQADAILSSVVIGGVCKNSDFPSASSQTVSVAAQNAGDQYNLSARNYSVSGFSNVSGSGTAMSGGTSQIIKIVNQADVDGGKQKIIDQNVQAAKDELTKQLNADGYTPIADTFSSANPVVVASPNVGETGDNVNVNVTITYTMTGVKQSDLKDFVESDIKQHIDANKQTILDNGLGAATFQVTEKQASGDVRISLQTTATAGVAQDIDAIKKSVIGKKKGDTQNTIQQRPGVKEVNVSYSPFWVITTPKKLSHITIVFEQSNDNANSNP